MRYFSYNAHLNARLRRVLDHAFSSYSAYRKDVLVARTLAFASVLGNSPQTIESYPSNESSKMIKFNSEDDAETISIKLNRNDTSVKAKNTKTNNENLEAFIKDIDDVHEFMHRFIKCRDCGGHVPSNYDSDLKSKDKSDPCACNEVNQNGKNGTQTLAPLEGWQPYLERSNIVVLSKLNVETGLYAFKMYARFDDVCADDFIDVQIDMSQYRYKWDNTTDELYIIDKKEEGKFAPGSSFDFEKSNRNFDRNSFSYIYYWRVIWPRFFSNRDYVCRRTGQMFDDVYVLKSQSVEHKEHSEVNGVVRVKDYDSVLVVKPLRSNDGGDWSKGGVEFCVTAYENPGLNLPSSLTSWVAMRGMPDFVSNLRKACLELRDKSNS